MSGPRRLPLWLTVLTLVTLTGLQHSRAEQLTSEQLAPMSEKDLYKEFDKAYAMMPDTDEVSRSSQQSNLLGKILTV